MTSSNFVGCSIGRSGRLAPLRILSTKNAAPRGISSGRLTFCDLHAVCIYHVLPRVALGSVASGCGTRCDNDAGTYGE